MTAAELERRLEAWHRAKFPGGVPPLVTLAKLVEEVGELADALLRGDEAHAREEAADAAIVLTHLVRGLGGNLRAEMVRKAIENERREP